MLQLIATAKNKLADYRTADFYINNYIGLLIGTKAGVIKNALMDSINRREFSFAEYDDLRNAFLRSARKENLAFHLEILARGIAASKDALDPDKSFFSKSIAFILEELSYEG